ncbi:hypothetical protein GDO78_022009 [Eleutherodactylus coqui]|uniref:Uncharacterized protein n=1 Tax=Eleutherodactylus coqui TaxID=57060 RepID=A0A8J6E9Q0_ELECQ|nr:hypothetical protein GDO78_022009 [Eleutherodactylus coqui]
MLTSRKVLLNNLNYVHLQHVSLGIHLSMHPEVTDTQRNLDIGVKDGCHKWKDSTMVDPNSNDPSMPCQCCDQHPGQKASIQYSSFEDLDMIIRDECLSPNDLPLSPLSLSSPSTDSSSSSDFTLDDSPASMCYKEYAQDGLDTPDQQPDIIPLDTVSEGQFSLEALSLSPQEANTTLNSNLSETNNNMEAEDTPFIDWGSDSMLDSNTNTLIEKLGFSSMDSNTIPEPESQTNSIGADHWSDEQNLLPGLPLPENTSMPTTKKTITSFHELALRRRSGGQLPKRDRSDWLIVFSPDTEQPPVNELTTSAFYHGVQEAHTHLLAVGKDVTTFQELRYRNALNKQSVLQLKAQDERPSTTSTEATTEPSPTGEVMHAAWEPNYSQQLLPAKTEQVDGIIGDRNIQKQESQSLKSPASQSGPQTAHANIQGKDHTQCGPVDPLSAIENESAGCKENLDKSAPTITWIRGMADGGDRRGQEDPVVSSTPGDIPLPHPVVSYTPGEIPLPDPIVSYTTGDIPPPDPVVSSTPGDIPPPDPIVSSTPGDIPPPDPVVSSTPGDIPPPDPIVSSTPGGIPSPDPIVRSTPGDIPPDPVVSTTPGGI